MSYGPILQVRKLSPQVMNAQMCIVFGELYFFPILLKMAISWRYKKNQELVTHPTWALLSHSAPNSVLLWGNALSYMEQNVIEASLHWVICNVSQPWTIWQFCASYFFVVDGGSCPAHYKMFSSISDLYPLSANRAHTLNLVTVIIRDFSRHCQMSSKETKITPGWEPLSYCYIPTVMMVSYLHGGTIENRLLWAAQKGDAKPAKHTGKKRKLSKLVFFFFMGNQTHAFTLVGQGKINMPAVSVASALLVG